MKQPGFPLFHSGNKTKILVGGTEFFPALLQRIQTAEISVHIETYIFEKDSTGEMFLKALLDAATRGVRVRLLVDGFGSAKFAREIKARLGKRAEVNIYRPIRLFSFLRKRGFRRLHRKIALIDGTVAFVGGINIVDDIVPGQPGPRYDFAMQVEGPVVAQLQKNIRRVWTLVERVNSRKADFISPTVRTPAGDEFAAFVVRTNLGHRHDIEHAYLSAIKNSEKEIIIASAYFLPGAKFLRALRRAKRRGVRVILLLQGRIEYPLVHFATQALYARLLSFGIEIYEYQQSFLHAKVAVIDGLWLTVGSSNIDPVSLFLSKEANVFVYSKNSAATLRSYLKNALDDSLIIKPESWTHRSLMARFAHAISYWVVRLLVRIFINTAK